jgi:hypothetical protein
MKKTLLKFSSGIYLLAFRKFSKASFWEINLNDLTILCDCSEKEAIFACKEFNAVIINSHDEVPTGVVREMGERLPSYLYATK